MLTWAHGSLSMNLGALVEPPSKLHNQAEIPYPMPEDQPILSFFSMETEVVEPHTLNTQCAWPLAGARAYPSLEGSSSAAPTFMKPRDLCARPVSG